jgi:SEL1 protein
MLQLGDSHWYGRGAERNWQTAAQMYQTASKFRNAQALFNLGFMHEYGAGLPQVTQPH